MKKQSIEELVSRLVDWYKDASNWEQTQAMSAARKKLDEPQRPNAYTRRQAKIEAEQRRRRYED